MSDNPLNKVIDKVGDRETGRFFEIGHVTSYDPKTHTAVVTIPFLDVTTEALRVMTPRIGRRYNLRQGQECIVIFPNGDPMDSEARVFPLFYGSAAPPQPDGSVNPVYGGEEWVDEGTSAPTGAGRDECYAYARRLLYGFIELGALATYGVLLGEPCAAAYNSHIHLGLFAIPVTPTLPTNWFVPVTHISQTVKVQQ